jgi:hypothetical protein
MTNFLNGPPLAIVIKDILAEDGCRAAVAFWGRGCDTWVTGTNAKIIANLKMGGTNPHELKKVNAELKRCDRLHAKVYIGSRRAVVTSANASINGLALEGSEIASWIEAGIVTDDIDDISNWFDTLWLSDAHEITKSDWQRAEAAWSLRPRAKPSLASFGDFDTSAPVLPLLLWVNEGTWTVHENELQCQIGTADAGARKRVDDGVTVQEAADETILLNRWLLTWHPGARQLIKGAPWFMQTSDVIVRRGFTAHDDQIVRDVVLAPENPAPPPFDPTEKRFVEALRVILKRPKYAALSEDEVPGRPWFADRELLMRSFWPDIKAVYNQTDTYD